jgi:hypothetical protein
VRRLPPAAGRARLRGDAGHAADYRRNIHPAHDGNTGDALFPRQCGRCHNTSAWSPAIIVAATIAMRQNGLSRAGHDGRFVISRGAHRAAACRDCHPSEARPRLVACAGCHTRGRLVDLSAQACLRCHPGGRAR